MAIYHFSAQVIKRSEGRSATSASAYRAGEKIKDERLNTTFNYAKKEVADSFILAPDDSPDWVYDRAILWNEIEKIEKRKDAQLAREINVALPIELNFHQQKELLQDFVFHHFVEKGMVADCAIHLDNPENPHAHIMLTMREVSEDGFGKKNRDWNDKQLLEDWRKEWAEFANKSLEKANVKTRIDHRSYKEQGIDKLPQKHESVHVRAMERKGIKTMVRQYNNQVKMINQQIVQLNKEIEQTKAEIAIAFVPEDEATEKEKRIDEILKESKAKKEKELQSVSSHAYEKLKLMKERDNIDEEIKKLDEGMEKIEGHFKDLKKLPKIIREKEKELSDLKAQNPIFKLFNRKQYQNTKNKIEKELEANYERLNVLKDKLPDLYESRTKIHDDKIKLESQKRELNQQMTSKLYKTNDKSKGKELD